MPLRRFAGCALALATLCACGGGGGAVTPPASSGSGRSTASLGRVRATIVIPGTATSARKGRAYISPATNGLVIAVAQVSGGTTTTYSDTGYDLTANATTCTQGATNRTCVISFDAPATSATQSDLFSIYAYDAAQTAAAVSASYVPSGSLLSEDVGLSGTGDPVPSTTGTTNGAITAGIVNDVTFVLAPVVATPIASIGGALAGTTTPLVLSVPGAGGTSNTLAVDGYDADGKMIAAYLAPNSGDDVYVNPISDTLTGADAAEFALSRSPVTSALADGVTATYTPQSGDTPTTAGSTAVAGTILISDSLSNAGYGGTATLSNESETITIAPLYPFVSDSPSIGATTLTAQVYAIQSAVPTGSPGYTLTASTAAMPNDCSEYTATGPTSGASGTSQQAVFTVTTMATPAAGTTCTFALSDGISTDPIVFNPDGSFTDLRTRFGSRGRTDSNIRR